AELPVRMQLFSVPRYAPPPKSPAELPLNTHLDTTALADSQNTPPPLSLAVPFVSVKPTSAVSLIIYTQRISPAPAITVTSGPLTLRTVSGLSTATRFVVVPSTVRPPIE